MGTACNETLTMPGSYAVMSQEEMTYVEGCGVVHPVGPGLFDKSVCLSVAAAYIGGGVIKGMTGLEIAQELYAHAVAYYMAPGLLASGIVNYSIYKELRERAGMVNLEDGGETRPGFKAAYKVIWNFNF